MTATHPSVGSGSTGARGPLAPLVTLGVVMLTLPSHEGRAADWYADTALRQAFGYQDNILLSTSSGDKEGSFSSTSSALLDLGRRDEITDINLNTKFDFVRYFSQPKADTDNQYAVLNGAFKAERSLWQVNAGVIRDTSLDSDLPPEGTVTLSARRRTTINAGPSWSYQLSPLETVNLSADWSKVDYSYPQYVDYWQVTGGAGYTRVLTEQTQLNLSASALNYESDKSASLNQQYFTAQVGLAHAFSPLWKASFLIGPSMTISESSSRQVINIGNGQRVTIGGAEQGTTFGFAARAETSYQVTDRLVAGLNYSHSATPNNSGQLLTADAVGVNFQQAVISFMDVFLNATYVKQTGTASNSSSNDRDYVNAQPGLRWKLTEQISLDTSYQFSWQRYASSGASATSQGAFLTLNYDFPRWQTF